MGERPFAPKSNFKAYLEYKREREEEVEEEKAKNEDGKNDDDDGNDKKTSENKEGKSIGQAT